MSTGSREHAIGHKCLWTTYRYNVIAMEHDICTLMNI